MDYAFCHNIREYYGASVAFFGHTSFGGWAALDAGHLGWGLFNLLNWPLWVEFILTLLILDFMIWAQHWATHKIPLLWRLHQVHHADVDFDVSTAIRFHPVEIALSMVLKIGIVYALGPMAWAVVVFEILLNGTALFNHANIALPVWLDKGCVG